MQFWEKLKKRWEVESNWQVLMILLVFAITGFSVLYVKNPVFEWCRYHHIENTWLKVLAYIGIMYPLYQFLLIFVGTILGQYRFFSKFLLRMNRRMIQPFMKKKHG
jgi:hypothetical protein